MARSSEAGTHFHGKKRAAECDPDGDQPLAKKFGRLHIDTVWHATQPELNQTSTVRGTSSELNDVMLLDDTKTTTYIHDLDHEIAEIEAQEGSIAFLSGIADKIGSIPMSILTNSRPHSNELVLYQEPTSLTIPKEQDIVRRAIIESKARARARQSGLQENYDANVTAGAGGHENPSIPNKSCSDDVMMDIDTQT